MLNEMKFMSIEFANCHDDVYRNWPLDDTVYCEVVEQKEQVTVY